MDCDPVRKDPFYLIENTRIIFKKYFQKIISKNNWNNSDFYSGYFPGNLPEEFLYNFNEINSC